MTDVPNKSFFRRDDLIALLVIIGFVIGAFVFQIQERINTTVRETHALRGYFGEVFLAWGIWSVTLAVLIVGLLVSLDHYWRWIAAVASSIWVVWSIDMTIINFKGFWNVERILDGLWLDFALFMPFAMMVAWCIYILEKIVDE